MTEFIHHMETAPQLSRSHPTIPAPSLYSSPNGLPIPGFFAC